MYVQRENGVITGAFGSPQPEVAEEWLADDSAELLAFLTPMSAQRATVDGERDKRTAAGFLFGGVLYQARPLDIQNITGAGALAGLAALAGAQAGDYRWHGGDTDFEWIAEDDSRVAMDAPTCFAFSKAAMAHVAAHVFAGNAIKALLAGETPPADITDDALWP
jgi:hypothetical protein